MKVLLSLKSHYKQYCINWFSNKYHDFIIAIKKVQTGDYFPNVPTYLYYSTYRHLIVGFDFS